MTFCPSLAPTSLTPSVSIPLRFSAIYYKRNHQSDEEFEDMLKKNYSNNIEGSKAKRQEFSTFLQGIKDPSSNTNAEKLGEVLRGGRGETKRHYAVNEELYGTEEGVRLRKEAEDKQKQQTRRKDQRQRDQKGEAVSKDWKDELEEASAMTGGGSNKAKAKNNKKDKRSRKKASDTDPGNKGSGNVDTKQVALVSGIAVAAAGLGFLLGFGKKQ